MREMIDNANILGHKLRNKAMEKKKYWIDNLIQ